jgi:hypothetical protein
MRCLICGSCDFEFVDTIISDFVMARIKKDFKPGDNYKTKLLFCNKCSFAFYDYRFTTEEICNLYKDYRGFEYQKLRERYECWYTTNVNNLLNLDSVYLTEQRNQISSMIFSNVNREIKSALDYGGNEGRTFTKEIGTEQKYIYDISGVPTVDGITSILKESDLSKYQYDLIMCNMLFEHLSSPIHILNKISRIGNNRTLFYIEVPSENPFTKGNKLSILKNISLVTNKNFSIIRLIKYYIKSRKEPFMPMKEHINFFSINSMETMLNNNGFRVLALCEQKRNSSLGKSDVLSVLFQKK